MEQPHVNSSPSAGLQTIFQFVHHGRTDVHVSSSSETQDLNCTQHKPTCSMLATVDHILAHLLQQRGDGFCGPWVTANHECEVASICKQTVMWHT